MNVSATDPTTAGLANQAAASSTPKKPTPAAAAVPVAATPVAQGHHIGRSEGAGAALISRAAVAMITLSTTACTGGR